MTKSSKAEYHAGYVVNLLSLIDRDGQDKKYINRVNKIFYNLSKLKYHYSPLLTLKNPVAGDIVIEVNNILEPIKNHIIFKKCIARFKSEYKSHEKWLDKQL